MRRKQGRDCILIFETLDLTIPKAFWYRLQLCESIILFLTKLTSSPHSQQILKAHWVGSAPAIPHSICFLCKLSSLQN